MAKKKQNLFEDFKRWHPIFSGCKNASAELGEDKFTEEHRHAAAAFIRDFDKETNPDNLQLETETRIMAEHGSKEEVTEWVERGEKHYGKRLDSMLKKQFDDLYSSTPEGVKSELYQLVTSFTPKTKIRNARFKKALEYHTYLAEINPLLAEYQSKNITPGRRNQIEKQLVEQRCKEYDKLYSTKDPKKAAEYKEIVKLLKKNAKDKPKIVLEIFAEKQRKYQEEFEKLIKPKDLKEYMTTVLDTDNLRKLYGTAILYHGHAEEDKKKKERSEILG